MTELESIPSTSSSPPVSAPAEIIEAIKEFLSMLEHGPEPAQARLTRLERSLDRLAYLQHFVRAPAEPAYSQPPPASNYRALRNAVATQFPLLGSYRLPSPVLRIGRGEIEVADAIDDLTEIASELHDVLWHSEHSSLDEALWQYRHGYQSHWREHVRGLQFHLLSLQQGGTRQDGG